MGTIVSANKRYWLLLGTPKGPYLASEVLSRIALGEVAPETPICEEGSEYWMPVSRWRESIDPIPISPSETPRVTSVPVLVPTESPTVPSRQDTPTVTAPSFSPSAETVGIAIGIAILLVGVALVAGAGYGLYEWLRPLSAKEACLRFSAASTPYEAKKYASPRMHTAINSLFSDKTPNDPNDTFDLTTEIDGPQPFIKLVGFRGQLFIEEAGRRVKMEGHCRMVKSDGWKVDDMVFTNVDGQFLPSPYSIVDEQKKTSSLWSSSSKNAGTSKADPQVRDTRAWYERLPLKQIFFAVVVCFGIGGVIKRSGKK